MASRDPANKGIGLSNEGLGDIEFASDVMARMHPDAAPIDPALARLSQYKGNPLNLQGYYVPQDYSSEDLKRLAMQNIAPNGTQLGTEAGTVNVLPTAENSASTWAHEYRHQQDPARSHGSIRYDDAFYAPNEREFNEELSQFRQKYGNSLSFGGARSLEWDRDNENVRQSRFQNEDGYNAKLRRMLGVGKADLARERERMARQPEINRKIRLADILRGK